MILSDCPELREIEWRCVIIDEAHRLKNRNCKLLDSLKHMDLVLGGGRGPMGRYGVRTCPMGRYGVKEEPYGAVWG